MESQAKKESHQSYVEGEGIKDGATKDGKKSGLQGPVQGMSARVSRKR